MVPPPPPPAGEDAESSDPDREKRKYLRRLNTALNTLRKNLETTSNEQVADGDILLKTLENQVSAKKSYMHLRDRCRWRPGEQSEISSVLFHRVAQLMSRCGSMTRTGDQGTPFRGELDTMWCDSSCAAAPCDSTLCVCPLVVNLLSTFCSWANPPKQCHVWMYASRGR